MMKKLNVSFDMLRSRMDFICSKFSSFRVDEFIQGVTYKVSTQLQLRKNY